MALWAVVVAHKPDPSLVVAEGARPRLLRVHRPMKNKHALSFGF